VSQVARYFPKQFQWLSNTHKNSVQHDCNIERKIFLGVNGQYGFPENKSFPRGAGPRWIKSPQLTDLHTGLGELRGWRLCRRRLISREQMRFLAAACEKKARFVAGCSEAGLAVARLGCRVLDGYRSIRH